MDVHLLKSFKDKRTLEELKVLMTPNPEIIDLISCPYQKLMELRLKEVPNLFKVEEEVFSFRHESNLVISKFQSKTRPAPELQPSFEERTFFENGINYLGVLKINRIVIRILGTGSYDPASNDPYLTKRNYAIIIGIFCASLYALKFSGAEAFRRVFKVFEPNKTYKTHKCLVDYMKYQVEEAVINRREPLDYGQYLRQQLNKDDILKKDFEDLAMYLNLFELYPGDEMLPCEKYISALETLGNETVANSKVIHFIKSQKNDIYLLPDPHFIKQLANMEHDENVYDIRFLSKKLDKLEETYSNRLKEALSTRKEALNQGQSRNKIQEIVKPYTDCTIF